MARAVFSTDAILDAARAVVVERGARGLTVEAIARASGAPVGSIYHRFRSVDELLARAWLRAVRRLQCAALAVRVSVEDPIASAQAVALASYDHCVSEPADTLLLDAVSHAELLALDLPELHEQLRTVNDEVQARMSELARAVFGRADRRGRDLVLLALVDLPHGFVGRQLRSGRAAPARRGRLAAAVAAVLEQPGEHVKGASIG
jgi:AcrR family transcriptional regulator